MSESTDLIPFQQTHQYVGIAGDSLACGIALALGSMPEIQIRSLAVGGSGLVLLENSVLALLQGNVRGLIISCGTNDWAWPNLDWVGYQARLRALMQIIPEAIKVCFWLPPESADGYLDNLPDVRNTIEQALAGIVAVKIEHWPDDPELPADHVHRSAKAYKNAALISLAVLNDNLGHHSDLQY